MSEMLKITKKEILAQIPTDSQRYLGVNYILTKLGMDAEDVKSEDLDRLKASVSFLRSKRNSRFNEASRKIDKFESNNSAWLDSEFHISNVVEVIWIILFLNRDLVDLLSNLMKNQIHLSDEKLR